MTTKKNRPLFRVLMNIIYEESHGDKKKQEDDSVKLFHPFQSFRFLNLHKIRQQKLKEELLSLVFQVVSIRWVNKIFPKSAKET